MSSEVTYNTKSYRNDGWISQFGLYRYESATSPKSMEYERRSRLIMRIVFLLGAVMFLAFLIFYIAVYMSNYNETDRMIFLNKLESESIDPNYVSPLTTVFYPDDQISSYQQQKTISSTTPMSSERSPPTNVTTSSAQTLFDRALITNSVSSPTTTTINRHPSNHKRHYSNVYRDNELETGTADPSIRKSILKTISPQKRMFLPDDNDFEYVDSNQNVNSIQDILNQNNNENDDDDDYGGAAGAHIPISPPSMPFSRTMKVEGIYRREKKKRDHLNAMETVQTFTGQHSTATVADLYEGGVRNRKDPFSKFKPSKPSDVNLLVGNHMMKHHHKQHYTYHKPRPLTTATTTLSNYYEENYGVQDPNMIYHQIIAANNNKNRDAAIRNGRYEKPLKSNKPFSLMLDVYPMPEEIGTAFDSSQPPISTRIAPYAPPSSSSSYPSASYNQYRRPFYPVNSQVINHNLQYSKENSFYNHLKFPQIQQFPPYSRGGGGSGTPFVVGHKNDGFYHNYVTQRAMNSNVFRPILRPSQSSQQLLPAIDSMATEEAPSQITVHLNLYPDRKKYQTRNVEVLQTGGNTQLVDTVPAASGLPVRGDDASLWKRLQRRENSTKPNFAPTVTAVESVEIHPVQQQNPYIPPFSAIKINALQHPFQLNDTTNLLSSLQSTDQPDKSPEYDLVAFDSKRLVPNIKSTVNIQYPTVNSIVSTSSYFDDVPTTSISSEPPSTFASSGSSQFESTMSSSLFTSPTAAAVDHFSYFSTNIPFENSMIVAATANALNESEADQVTTIYDNTIRFPDH